MKMIVAVPALIALAACQQTGAPSDNDMAEPAADEMSEAADPAAAEADISAAESAQIAALNNHDLAGATAVYAADAEFFDAGSPAVQGSEAIGSTFEQMLADESVAIDFRPVKQVISDDGTMAYTTATYSFTSTDPETGESVTSRGANLTVWQRQADGSWKIVADYNAPTE